MSHHGQNGSNLAKSPKVALKKKKDQGNILHEEKRNFRLILNCVNCVMILMRLLKIPQI